MAQESRIVGMSLRNTADRQSRTASQAVPHPAQPQKESLPPQPGVGKRGRQSHLQTVPAAVPALMDIALPPLQLSQRDLTFSSNRQTSHSPNNQANPKSDKNRSAIPQLIQK